MCALSTALGAAPAPPADLQASFKFLTSERAQGGVLYRASTGDLRGALLPLSFVDTPAYWGEHVCRNSVAMCGITDRYDAQSYTLRPERNAAGDLQTERVNIHDGSNIYDSATWQIAVMLGAARRQFSMFKTLDAYALINNQNRLLQLGYSGDARLPVPDQNRALTRAAVFTYNGARIDEGRRAFVFRTLPRSWLATDPLRGSRYDSWIKASDLPASNSWYQRGKISWTDWKPITGENAWAFLIGPLQAAKIHFIESKQQRYVPFQELAVQNALAVLPTFAAMQAAIGAVYYAPAGTVANQGDELVSPYEVAVENNFSLYAGLKLLRATLQLQQTHQADLTAADRAAIGAATRLIDAMIHGGKTIDGRSTEGLLAFFKNRAWREGEFVQGGFANDPARKESWSARTQPRAVDVNTWGIAALGAEQIDQWFGFGAAYNNWQRVKSWGGYGAGPTLWGVGFSDQDGNGRDADGNYRQGILSTEWTAGAVNAVRALRRHYAGVGNTSRNFSAARHFAISLAEDERAMLGALRSMRSDQFREATGLETRPSAATWLPSAEGAYLYASRRYLIPFGWYANPLPSTCATAWVIMLAHDFDPFAD